MTLALAIGAGALVAIGLAVGRLLSGPQEADRVVALDVTFAASVALTGAATLATGRALFLDIGVGLSLVGFVATSAMRARAATRRRGAAGTVSFFVDRTGMPCDDSELASARA